LASRLQLEKEKLRLRSFAQQQAAWFSGHLRNSTRHNPPSTHHSLQRWARAPLAQVSTPPSLLVPSPPTYFVLRLFQPSPPFSFSSLIS